VCPVRTLQPARTAEGFLPVVVTTPVVPSYAIVTHGAVDIAALDVTATKRSGGGDMRVIAGSAKVGR
jgi:hypothetical protein